MLLIRQPVPVGFFVISLETYSDLFNSMVKIGIQQVANTIPNAVFLAFFTYYLLLWKGIGRSYSSRWLIAFTYPRHFSITCCISGGRGASKNREAPVTG
jgi:hypothetical protein